MNEFDSKLLVVAVEHMRAQYKEIERLEAVLQKIADGRTEDPQYEAMKVLGLLSTGP